MQGNYFYGHGKLLLCSEYFVLDGAKSIALPTTLGQNMTVKYQRSSEPKIIWKSYDSNGTLWFEAEYDLWRFNCLTNESREAKVLQSILRQARIQNIHFLREEVDTFVETRLEFPLNWGLGSSSSLIYNIAQWAYVSPFELQDKTIGGSGYDIACAQSTGPISFQKSAARHTWESTHFNPVFKDQIYFVYLNKKQNTAVSIERYYSLNIDNKEKTIRDLNSIADEMTDCTDLKSFNDLIFDHEKLISHSLDMPRAKDLYFHNYFGEIKSLGAWGGDFVMVTSDRSFEDTKRYFSALGFEIILTFDELISQNTPSGAGISVLKDELRIGQ